MIGSKFMTQNTNISFVVTFEPIRFRHFLAPQNDRLNLSFVEDEDTYGKTLGRNGLIRVI